MTLELSELRGTSRHWTRNERHWVCAENPLKKGLGPGAKEFEFCGIGVRKPQSFLRRGVPIFLNVIW